MGKKELVQEIVSLLEKRGFAYSRLYSPCLDIYAKKGDTSLLIKVLDNIDSLRSDTSEEMKDLASFLGACPLLIGDHSGKSELQDQVVYERYGVPAVRYSTLGSVLQEERQVFIEHHRGGYYVRIDADKVKDRRQQRDLSLSQLAKLTGLTRKTLEKYEQGGKACLDRAKELEQVLGDVVREIGLLQQRAEEELELEVESPTAQRLAELGLRSLELKKTPFDVCAKDGDITYIVRHQAKKPRDKVVKLLSSLEEAIPSRPFFVTQEEKYIGDIPSLSEKKLQHIKDKDELRDRVA